MRYTQTQTCGCIYECTDVAPDAGNTLQGFNMTAIKLCQFHQEVRTDQTALDFTIVTTPDWSSDGCQQN